MCLKIILFSTKIKLFYTASGLNSDKNQSLAKLKLQHLLHRLWVEYFLYFSVKNKVNATNRLMLLWGMQFIFPLTHQALEVHLFLYNFDLTYINSSLFFTQDITSTWLNTSLFQQVIALSFCFNLFVNLNNQLTDQFSLTYTESYFAFHRLEKILWKD